MTSGPQGLDPITLRVVAGALRAACEEMGAVLVRAAHSANIKERRDASTALFDAEGELVMQAEHIPVHLGAMPAAVAAVLGEDHSPGEAWVLNDPYRGGTHLPDITVISPVFCGDEDPDPAELRSAFDAAHAERYGYADEAAELELVTVRVAVALPGSELRAGALGEREPAGSRPAHLGGERVEASVHRGAIDRVAGPAIVELPEATLAVPPGWSGGARDDGTIVLEREAAGSP